MHKPLSKEDVQRKASSMLLQVVDDLEHQRMGKPHVTPVHSFDAYMVHGDEDHGYLRPVRIEACAYDDRKNPGKKATIGLRLRISAGGEDVGGPLFPLKPYAEKAGLEPLPETRTSFSDMLDGQLAVTAGSYYLQEGQPQQHMGHGTGEWQDATLVIHPDDLAAIKSRLLQPPTRELSRGQGGYLDR